MRKTFLIAFVLTLPACFAQAQDTAKGTTFHHLAKIGSDIFSGSKPHTDADFEYLRGLGVRYILEVHFLPGFIGPEKRRARRYGIGFLAVPMNGSPIAPAEKHVNEALAIMRNKAYQPIYVHCVLGRDRTSLLMGLYRVYFTGIARDQAYQEMKTAGFRDRWFLIGLKHYFDRHLSVPEALKNLTTESR